MLNIVIFGAPGSGKGTQSARIVEKYGLNHISTGDVLRGEIAAGTELGKTAKALIDHGQLIPDALMVDILASKLDSLTAGNGVIFDGFPRTIAQAEALKAMLAERGQDVTAMIELDVPEDELMTRLLKRGEESGRADDNEETIKKRLVVYAEQTGASHEQTVRALILSHLTVIYIKQSLGRLSALCGCVVAATGSSCGITYLMGGGYEEVTHAVKNMIANLAGMICDGAKPSCAMKCASGVSMAVVSALMAMNNRCVKSVEGIIDDDVDKSIRNLTDIGRDAMTQTDAMILRIMTSKS